MVMLVPPVKEEDTESTGQLDQFKWIAEPPVMYVASSYVLGHEA